jgi:hypothetical protein
VRTTRRHLRSAASPQVRSHHWGCSGQPSLPEDSFEVELDLMAQKGVYGRQCLATGERGVQPGALHRSRNGWLRRSGVNDEADRERPLPTPSEPFRSLTERSTALAQSHRFEHVLGTSARPQRTALLDADPLFWGVPHPDIAGEWLLPPWKRASQQGRFLRSTTTVVTTVAMA